MFLVCSEISINVIDKHFQNFNIMRALSLPEKKQNKIKIEKSKTEMIKIISYI